MEENQFQTEPKISDAHNEEPTSVDNSTFEQNENTVTKKNLLEENGESTKLEKKNVDPEQELILGKFKSVEELKKAYQELQKYQGNSSEELGNLRKEIANLNEYKDQFQIFNVLQQEYSDVIKRDKEKYQEKGYFENPTFKEIYKEALGVFGANLDTDRMINLLENYAESKILANEKKKVAEKETQKTLDAMTFSECSKTTFTPPKKRFDEMTEKEIDELLERLI